jgi:hypothetical protein
MVFWPTVTCSSERAWYVRGTYHLYPPGQRVRRERNQQQESANHAAWQPATASFQSFHPTFTKLYTYTHMSTYRFIIAIWFCLTSTEITRHSTRRLTGINAKYTCHSEERSEQKLLRKIRERELTKSGGYNRANTLELSYMYIPNLLHFKM